jgi:hypothetical protein
MIRRKNVQTGIKNSNYGNNNHDDTNKSNNNKITIMMITIIRIIRIKLKITRTTRKQRSSFMMKTKTKKNLSSAWM